MKLEQFLEETGKEFDEEFGTHLEWGDGDLIKAPELKSFLLSKIKEGVELDREECVRKIERLDRVSTVTGTFDGKPFILIDRDEVIKILRG